MSSSCFEIQGSLNDCRTILSTASGKQFAPPNMGDPTDILHELVRLPANGSSLWKWSTVSCNNADALKNTLRMLGMDYRFQARCDVHDWQPVEIDIFATRTNQTVWSIPRRTLPHTLQSAVNHCAGSSTMLLPHDGICSRCIETGASCRGCCLRRVFPSSIESSPDVLVFQIQPSGFGLEIVCPTVSETLTYTAAYVLVCVVSFRSLSGVDGSANVSQRTQGHFVSQFSARGVVWRYDDCLFGGQAQQLLAFDLEALAANGDPYLVAYRKQAVHS